MSAREKISRFVEANKSPDHPPFDPETGHAVDDPEAHLTALLDEYAHELAEDLREWAAEAHPEDGEPQEFYGNRGSFYRDAADFIDPEAAEGDAEDMEGSEEPTP